MAMSGRQAWRSFQAVEKRRRCGGGDGRNRHVGQQRGQRQLNDGDKGRRKNTGFIHQVLGRGLGLIQVDVTVAMFIMMMPRALEVHGRVGHLIRIRQQHGRAGIGERLPAHAEHQEEGGEPAAHGGGV